MGVEVLVGGATRAELARVRSLFDEWDATFSLFRADSELNRVNARAHDVTTSPLFARVLRVAFDAARATGGLVHPRPRRTTLDLNGVVKSLAVDEALALLAGPGLVSAGGDVATRGSAVVGLPGGGSLTLADGGLATSGTTKRGPHLLDPATGRSSRSRWTEVTVAASSCLDADVAAKAAFLLDAAGPAWLDERGLAGRFRAGEIVVTNHAWRRALPEAA